MSLSQERPVLQVHPNSQLPPMAPPTGTRPMGPNSRGSSTTYNHQWEIEKLASLNRSLREMEEKLILIKTNANILSVELATAMSPTPDQSLVQLKYSFEKCVQQYESYSKEMLKTLDTLKVRKELNGNLQ